jgi:hypothetical protein
MNILQKNQSVNIEKVLAPHDLLDCGEVASPRVGRRKPSVSAGIYKSVLRGNTPGSGMLVAVKFRGCRGRSSASPVFRAWDWAEMHKKAEGQPCNKAQKAWSIPELSCGSKGTHTSHAYIHPHTQLPCNNQYKTVATKEKRTSVDKEIDSVG